MRVKSIAMSLAVAATVAVSVYCCMTTRVPSINDGNDFSSAGIYEQWKQGNVILMVRHAERCDRSSNPCSGDPTGITVVGRQQAQAVAQALHTLGLGNATLISSPETRTQQTADIIAGHRVPPQDWVDRCDESFRDAAMAHKVSGTNLVLITHSGCIDHFERTLKVAAGARHADYAEAFFIEAQSATNPKILGAVEVSQWQSINLPTSK